MKPPGRRWFTTPLWVALLGLGVMAGLGGCASAPRSDAAREDRLALSEANQDLVQGTLAAVEIRGQSAVTVRETVESVFTEAGFQAGKHQPEVLLFERPASRSLVRRYGSWGGIEVRMRLKVEITPQNSGVQLLRCRSYIVREPGSATEGEQPLARRLVREYEGLLHEVGARLN